MTGHYHWRCGPLLIGIMVAGGFSLNNRTQIGAALGGSQPLPHGRGSDWWRPIAHGRLAFTPTLHDATLANAEWRIANYASDASNRGRETIPAVRCQCPAPARREHDERAQGESPPIKRNAPVKVQALGAGGASLAGTNLWMRTPTRDDPGACCTGSMCTEMIEADCIAAGGFWLAETSCPPANPVNPCELGACCIGPAECVDDDGAGITEDDCITIWEGVYIGGARCADGPCPVCFFAGPAYCHEINIDGSAWLINGEYGFRAADDFQVEGPPLVTEMCWTVAFVGCAADPPEVEWHVAFYEDNNGLPGALVPPGQQTITVDAAARWPEADSYLWDFQGHFGAVELTVGGCYWIEFEGTGDGFCPMYWWQGLDGNDHAITDNDGNYGADDLVPFDFNFCLDCGIADGDCGTILGACCLCPDSAEDPPTCYDENDPGYDGLQATCLDDFKGKWYPNEACEPDPGPCPDVPHNDLCADAIVVSGLAMGDPPVGTGPQPYPADNECAFTDGPDRTDCWNDGYDLRYDVWYRYVAECTGTLHISSCGDDTVLVNYDQLITVYNTGVCAEVSHDDNEILCEDDGCGVVGSATDIEMDVILGQEILVRIGGAEDDSYPDPAWSMGQGTVEFEMLTCG